VTQLQPDSSPSTQKYHPILELGRGGMAEVYLAVTLGQGGFTKLVVLKKTRAEFSQDPEFVTMFLDEARLAARLNHPNVVQTYEVGQEGNQYFIAMEYLDGQPLNRARNIGTKREPMPLLLHLQVLCGVLAGLHHAHELCDFDGTPLQVVHRDISPHNVFVTYDGHVKVVDFGIAKAAGAAAQTQAGAIKGKLAYMPPEQATGKPVDRRTDIFSVGVMLWEALAGVRMWAAVPDSGILFRLSSRDLPDLREAAPSAPPELLRIALRALAPDPAERYPTAAAMEADLTAYLAAQPQRVTPADIGRYVSQHYEEQRARIRRAIEEEVRKFRTGEAQREIPALAPASLDGASLRPSVGALQVTFSGNQPPPSVVPAAPLPPPPVAYHIAPTLQSMPSPLQQQARGGLGPRMALVGVCAVGGLVGGAFLALRTPQTEAATAAPAAQTGAPVGSSTPTTTARPAEPETSATPPPAVSASNATPAPSGAAPTPSLPRLVPVKSPPSRPPTDDRSDFGGRK
jgi:serine/threonine-protein kinase